MLISKVPDDEGRTEENREVPVNDNSHEYETASELFELLSKQQNFNSHDGSSLTPRDLVLLYKNMDLGTKLMNSTKELITEKPNQRVETIVYNDEPESDLSDVSDIYSNEDLQNMILINKEQIDFLNVEPSIENTLCHKLGDFEIQTTPDCDFSNHYLFKDPYIKEQLKNFNLLSNSSEMQGCVLPASLLDFVCCKRLEDNYNFYMDNIIRYVKNTIDQLKRISNGDYLTDKVKEKWQEVEHIQDPLHNNTKVLATSTSIPLQVECKIGGIKSTWDDIVHSAVDVRSLSKILEKRIIVEIPKLIKGSYTFLSKCCADNLIISCKKENEPVDDADESRVDVVLQLKRSETGHVVSNINSIMILQTAPLTQDPMPLAGPLPLMYKEEINESSDFNKKDLTVTEVTKQNSSQNDEQQDIDDVDVDCNNIDYKEKSPNYFNCRSGWNNCDSSCTSSGQGELTESSDSLSYRREDKFEVSQDDLRMTIQKLTMQSALPEETTEDLPQSPIMKKKSFTRVRIKSPYENQSFVMEEKKRRKLLEIREKRERSKMAMAENCKISKQKYGKGVVPQSTSSVTKLSITNKSFYNSIYGQNTNVDIKQELKKNKHKRELLDKSLEDSVENVGYEQEPTTMSVTEDTKKFINRCYYLDDTETEMMYMTMKQEEEKDKDICSASTSGISSDYQCNLNILSQLMAPFDSDADHNIKDETERYSSTVTPQHLLKEQNQNEQHQANELPTSKSSLNIVPSNSPKTFHRTEKDMNELKKITSSVECRKSIDKIYQLMNNMDKNQCSNNKSQNKLPVDSNDKTDSVTKGTSIQGSDSGTSLKHLPSSNPSTFSFDKNNNTEVSHQRPASRPINVIPKVIISSKSQIPVQKEEPEKNNNDCKEVIVSPTRKARESNPLKAISQLLHEFENVQRNRLKSGTEDKAVKKTNPVMSSEIKHTPRQRFYGRRSRIDQNNDPVEKRKVSSPKKTRQMAGMEVIKIPYQQVPIADRYIEKGGKRKIHDIIDEVKEARGEAVRGPSKFTSRLNSLAQPKRAYVQAHSEEYQIRYGRNLITDRLQRLAATPAQPIPDRAPRLAYTKQKTKRMSNEAMSAVSLKTQYQSALPIERADRTRHSHNSPESKEATKGFGPSYKHVNVPETPEPLTKRMADVESYVKNHYGHAPSSTVANVSRIPQKSRAPLLPNNIDIGSMSPRSPPEASTEVGIKLHRIIESMINHKSPGLEVLAECHETCSKSDENYVSENYSRCDERISIDSDDTTGTTDDKFSIDNREPVFKTSQRRDDAKETECAKYIIQPFHSATEVEKSKIALSRPFSVGTFSKNMRLNKLILTPKSSIQLFLLQSGDAGSLVTSISHLKSEKLLNVKPSSVLTKNPWDGIPLQITTVGYAFPEYNQHPHQTVSPSLSLLYKHVSKKSLKSSLVCQNLLTKPDHKNKIEQCFTDSKCYNHNIKLQSDQASQVCDIQTCAKPPTVTSSYDNNISSNVICWTNTVKPITSNEMPGGNKQKNLIENENQTKLTQTKITPEKSECTYSNCSETANDTTSLDILVGLLNEIHKITTCQTNITINETEKFNDNEIILNKHVDMETFQSSSCNVMSITSLKKLHSLESNQSIYSFYLSDHEVQDRLDNNFNPGLNLSFESSLNNFKFEPSNCADKGISVNIATKECMNRLTDVPSLFYPLAINHSTNVSNSFLGELCQLPTSLISLSDYYSSISNTSLTTFSHNSSKKILELPEIVIPRHDLNSNRAKLLQLKPKTVEKGTNVQKNIVKPKTKYYLKNTKFDPVMKMKRDFLVTLYSMLVLTVFAALSFPEVLYQVM